jgi:hypothetical protein
MYICFFVNNKKTKQGTHFLGQISDDYNRCFYIGSSFKFLLKVGLEESIVNAPLVSLQSKNTNKARSKVRFKQVIRDL